MLDEKRMVCSHVAAFLSDILFGTLLTKGLMQPKSLNETVLLSTQNIMIKLLSKKILTILLSKILSKPTCLNLWSQVNKHFFTSLKSVDSNQLASEVSLSGFTR